jgi:hypothetical protein
VVQVNEVYFLALFLRKGLQECDRLLNGRVGDLLQRSIREFGGAEERGIDECVVEVLQDLG